MKNVDELHVKLHSYNTDNDGCIPVVHTDSDHVYNYVTIIKNI